MTNFDFVKDICEETASEEPPPAQVEVCRYAGQVKASLVITGPHLTSSTNSSWPTHFSPHGHPPTKAASCIEDGHLAFCKIHRQRHYTTRNVQPAPVVRSRQRLLGMGRRQRQRLLGMETSASEKPGETAEKVTWKVLSLGLLNWLAKVWFAIVLLICSKSTCVTATKSLTEQSTPPGRKITFQEGGGLYTTHAPAKLSDDQEASKLCHIISAHSSLSIPTKSYRKRCPDRIYALLAYLTQHRYRGFNPIWLIPHSCQLW